MKKFLPWILATGVITVIFGTMYLVGLQMLRESANNLPRQIADDTAANFAGHAAFEGTPLPSKVDIAHSLAAFYIMYDQDGKPIGGTGYLNGTWPTVPYGVLLHAKTGHDHVITWQPQPGVRIATVTAKLSNGGYVLGGQSLSQTDQQADHVLWLSAIGWAISLGGMGIGYVLNTRLAKR